MGNSVAREPIILTRAENPTPVPTPPPVLDPINPNLARPLIIFGHYGIGKSMLTKMLLKQFGMPYEDLPSRHDDITVGVSGYKGTDACFPNNDKGSVALFDTEGGSRPRRNNEGYQATTIKDFVLATLAAIPGVIVYMTTEYDIEDEKNLFMVTSLMGKHHRLIVLHNRKAMSVTELPSLCRSFASNTTIPFEYDGRKELTCFVNGERIQNLFLFHHKELNNMGHNEKVLQEIASVLYFCTRPVPLDTVIFNVEDKHRNMINNFYRFTSATSIGEVHVEFRPLSNQEEMLEQLQQGVIIPKLKAIQIRGPINLSSVEIHPMENIALRSSLLEIRFQNYPQGAIEAKSVVIHQWLPQAVSPYVVYRNIESGSVIFIIQGL